jgi:hypothetical protein
MRTYSFRRNWLIAAALAASCIAALAASAGPADTSATLQPTEIAVGESAQLTIVTSGNLMEPVTLPVVSGLEFRIVGQSRRLESINGATMSTTATIVRVTPQTVGIFTIPGVTPKSQPLVLRVNSGNGSGGSSYPNSSGTFARPPVVANGGSVGGVHLTPDGSSFVRLNLPKHEIYVGESIPVDIQVGMRAGFVNSINGLPTLKGGDFTLNNLSHQPERVEKLIDGQPFTVITWHSNLAGIKPGTFSLNVEAPLTVRIRTRPQRESMIDDLLGDPFLQNLFGATITKEITVSSPPAEFTVLALPTEGRPTEFSGAVGNFKIDSDISAKTATAGDPLTLRMHVTGTGNFDRVDSPMLEHIDQWKTYPPKATFNPTDATGYKGEKTFEQPVIASRPGNQTLPGLAFSFFDPNTRRYETLRSSPVNVEVSAPGGNATASLAASPTAGAAGGSDATQGGLRPDHVATQAPVASVVPLHLQPRFLAIQCFVLLAFGGGWLGLRRRERGARDFRAHDRVTSRATDAVLRQMEAAAGSGDAALFFNTARAALQQSLAKRWQVDAERITIAEVEARLDGERDDVRQIFVLADEASYSGGDLKSTDFQRWAHIVRDELTETS